MQFTNFCFWPKADLLVTPKRSVFAQTWPTTWSVIRWSANQQCGAPCCSSVSYVRLCRSILCICDRQCDQILPTGRGSKTLAICRHKTLIFQTSGSVKWGVQKQMIFVTLCKLIPLGCQTADIGVPLRE